MRSRYAIAVALCLVTCLPASATDYEIIIEKMKFGSVPKQLKVGDTVTWKNADILRHTATALSGAFDLMLQPGSKTKTVLQTSGTFKVFCRYHPDMTVVLPIKK